MLRELLRNGIRARKRRVKCPNATRKPKQYIVQESGYLVQVDSLDVRPWPSVAIKQIISGDMLSALM